MEVCRLILSVHQPLSIAEERDADARHVGNKSVKLSYCHVELRRTTCIQNNDVWLGARESLEEHLLRIVEIGDGIITLSKLQLVAQSECESALLACAIVAIDEYRMMIRESLQERLDGSIILLVGILINLIDIGVVAHVATIYREWHHEANIVLLAEIAKRLDLMSVQRTEDNVAIGCARLAEQSLHVAINRQIPRLDIGRNALTL